MAAEAWMPWACPEDQRALDFDDGSLRCPAGHRFPVVEGVPRFVQSEDYAAAFGEQWNRFRLAQLDSEMGNPMARDRLRRVIGDELWERLPGMTVLEAGCGAGRFTEVLLTEGARVVSLDLSRAADANAETFPPAIDHAVAQADILKLPLPRESFGLVLALGVLQHTPSPERTIEELFTRVAPGGWIAIDHYSWSPYWAVRPTSSILRRRYRRLPPEEAMNRVDRLVDRYLPVHQRAAGHRHLARALHHMSPLRTYHSLVPDLTAEQQRDLARLDTHDSLTDVYKHRRTRRGIHKALVRAGAEEVECWRGGNGIEARASKRR